MAGQILLLPAVAIAATFIAQTDIGAVPVALWFGAASLAGVVAAVRQSDRRSEAIAALATASAVLAIVWLPVVIEQVTRRPGNLTALWRFFESGGDGQPFRGSFAAWADMLAGPFRPGFYLAHGWTLRRSHEAGTQAWAIGQMAALAAVLVASFRARDRFFSALALLLLVASGIAFWSVTRVEGEIIDHEIFWISGLGVANVALLAAAALEWTVRRRDDRWLAAVSVGAASIVVAVGLAKMNGVRANARSGSRETVAIRGAAAAIGDYMSSRHLQRPLITIDQESWQLAAGVLLELQKRGVPYAVEDDWIAMFTERVRAAGSEDVVLSVGGAAHHVVLGGRPGVVAVAAIDPVFVDALPIARAF